MGCRQSTVQDPSATCSTGARVPPPPPPPRGGAGGGLARSLSRRASKHTFNTSLSLASIDFNRTTRSKSHDNTQWKANVAAREVFGMSDLAEMPPLAKPKREGGRPSLMNIFSDLDTSSLHESITRYGRSIVSSEEHEHAPVHVISLPEQYHPDLRLAYGAHGSAGSCDYMEDRTVCRWMSTNDKPWGYFGVFDGHNGEGACNFLVDKLHEKISKHLEADSSWASAASKGIFAVDDEFLETTKDESGSTLIVMMVKESEIVLGALGDCQAVLCRGGKAINMCAVHKPDDPAERLRIEAANGRVIQSRVFGVLAVSRAIGDRDFKTARGEYRDKFNGDLVNAVADVKQQHILSEDEFIVLGSDGIFDILGPQQVVNYVHESLTRHGDIQQASEELVQYALSEGSSDNTSAVIVAFNQPQTIRLNSTEELRRGAKS